MNNLSIGFNPENYRYLDSRMVDETIKILKDAEFLDIVNDVIDNSDDPKYDAIYALIERIGEECGIRPELSYHDGWYLTFHEEDKFEKIVKPIWRQVEYYFNQICNSIPENGRWNQPG